MTRILTARFAFSAISSPLQPQLVGIPGVIELENYNEEGLAGDYV